MRIGRDVSCDLCPERLKDRREESVNPNGLQYAVKKACNTLRDNRVILLGGQVRQKDLRKWPSGSVGCSDGKERTGLLGADG